MASSPFQDNQPKQKHDAHYPAFENLLLNIERFDPQLRHFTLHLYYQVDVPAGIISPTEDIRGPQPGGGPWARQIHRIYDHTNRVELHHMLVDLYKDDRLVLETTRYFIVVIFDPCAGGDRFDQVQRLFPTAPTVPSVALIMCQGEILYKFTKEIAENYYEALPFVHQLESPVVGVPFEKLFPYFKEPRWSLDIPWEKPGRCGHYSEATQKWDEMIEGMGFSLPSNPNRVFGSNEVKQLRCHIFAEYLRWEQTSNDLMAIFGSITPHHIRRSQKLMESRYPTVRDWMNHALSGDISVLPAPAPKSCFATAYAHLKPNGSGTTTAANKATPTAIGCVSALSEALDANRVFKYKERAFHLTYTQPKKEQLPPISDERHPDEDYFAGLENPNPDEPPVPLPPLPGAAEEKFGLYPYFPRVAEMTIRFIGQFFMTRAPGAASDWEIVQEVDRLINEQHFLAALLAKIGDHETRLVCSRFVRERDCIKDTQN